MIKKGVIALVLLLFLVNFVVAVDSCSLDVRLINQDPYPVIPGDYVKLVFQIDGLEEDACGDVSIELVDKFPISFDPSEKNKVTVTSGIYERTYSSFLIVPYKLIVDEAALDGENELDILISTKGSQDVLYEFNFTVEDVRADFELFVKDYDVLTNIMTFEILNTGENDVEALTINIPDQENIVIKGANRNIVGDLDSNDYTTFEYEAISEGGEIELDVIYTDAINNRRTLTRTITYNPNNFVGRKADENGGNIGLYIGIVVVVVIIVWWLIAKGKKKKKRLATR